MKKIEIIAKEWIEGKGYSYTTTIDYIEVEDDESLQDVVNDYALNMVQEQYDADGTTIVNIVNDEKDITLIAKDENENIATAWLSDFVKQVTTK